MLEVRRVLGSLCLLLCWATAERGHAQAYTSIVIFGDSLSDTGNVAHVTQAAVGLPVPSPLGGNYTAGRFTDGLDTLPAARIYTGVWIEQLAATFPAKPTIKNSLDGGTDYAYGFGTTANGTSAFTFGPNNALSVPVNNAGQQISDYLATSPTITNKTLFVVWAGANDLINATSNANVIAAAGREVALVQRLITAGATDFILPNLPPLGLVPRFNGSTATSVPATQAVMGFNQALAAGLAALPMANTGKSLHLYPLDTYALFNAIVGPPVNAALTNTTAKSQSNAAVNPDTYFFWDDLHPTTTGHHLIALAAAALLSTPITTATTITSSALNANTGASVTFSAMLVPNVGTVAPMGTVSFLDGTTVLGTSAITGTGSVTYTTSTLSVGTHTITASYMGVNGFSSSTSAAITETITAPAVQGSLSPTSSTVARGASTSSTITLTAVGGFSGSATLACGTLPVHFACSFSQTSIPLSGTTLTGTSTLTVSTSVPLSSRLRLPSSSGSDSRAGAISFAFAPLGVAVTLLGLRRRRKGNSRPGRSKLPTLLLLGLLSCGAAVGLSGCGATDVVSPGTYDVPVTISASNGTASTVHLTVIVQ